MAWFETWFDTPYYHLLYKHRDFQEAENFITLLTDYLLLPPGATVIDLACGKGRHSVFLNKLGFKVLGTDLSRESIYHNKQFENDRLHFEVHDMRKALYPTVSREKVQGVFNLFTSFGYFETADDDRKVFGSVSEVLNKEGYFVLDFLNETIVRQEGESEYVTTREAIDFYIHKKICGEYIIKDIRFTDKGKPLYFQEKVKLHTLAQIKNFGAEVGLEVVDVFGNYALQPFLPSNSPRCIVIFKKIKT